MKTISKILCHDNTEHYSRLAAEKHLDKIYGELIGQITRDIVTLSRSGKDSIISVSDYIDSNLDKFIKLNTIKNDMILTPHNDNEE